MTEAALISWLKDESAIRCVLMEVGVQVNGVETTRYISNKGFVTGPLDTPANTIYSPAISGGVSFTESLSLEGETSLSYGDIELSNFQGDKDAWLKDVWTNRNVQVYIGDVTWNRSDFYKVFDGVVAAIDSRTRNKINLKISDKLQRLNTPVTENKLGGTATNKDTLLPLCFGECHNVTPLASDPANHEYQVHDGAIEDIIEVRDNGVPVNFTKYLSTGKFRLNQSPVGTITCSVQGAQAVQQLGTEKIINGTFTADTTGWTMVQSFGGSCAVVNGMLRVTSDGTWYPMAQQIIPTVIGKEYTLNATLGNYAKCSMHVGTGNTEPTKATIGANITAFPYKFTATTTTTYIGAQALMAAGEYADYDNISVVESAGVNAVANGGFDTNTAWNLDAGNSISGGTLNFNGTLPTSYAVQSNKLTVGKSYDIMFTISGYVSGQVDITTDGGGWTTGSKAANGTYTATLHSCAGTTAYIRGSQLNNANFAGSIDNVYIRESNLILNGGFTDTSAWVPGAGWTIANGVATAVNTTINIGQTMSFTAGRQYQVTFDMTATAGWLRAEMGGAYGTTMSTAGKYSAIITPSTSGGTLYIYGNVAFSGTIDNVVVKDVTELVTNGKFEGTLNGWTLTTGAVATFSGGVPTITTNSNSNLMTYQAVATEVGRKYRVTSGVPSGAGLGIYVGTGVGSASVYFSTVRGTAHDFVFTAVSTTTYINLHSGGAFTTSTFDNISVKEWYADAGYANTLVPLVKMLATKYGNTDTALAFTDLDMVSLNSFEPTAQQPLGLYLSDRANVLDVCNTLAKSIGARVAMNRQGQLYIVKLDLSNLVGGAIIDASLMVSKSLQVSQLPAVVAGSKVGYCKNWTVQTGLTTGLPEAHISMYAEEWLSSTVTDTAVADTYRLHTEPTLEETMLLVEADAIAEATRRLNMFKVQRKVMQYEAFSDLLFAKLGDVQTLKHERFNLSAGVPGQIISIETNWLNPHTTLEVLL